ncbi:MAG: CD225/dispanin family protein [Bacteroidales bacterium]|nr:CD225/dispanin family protein [Bacteroidales bacterium]
MYCRNCGAEMPGEDRFCASCGHEQQVAAVKKASGMEHRPENYLVLSIIVTVLCCLPFGIAGLIYSTKVDSCWDAGNADGARLYSRKARQWSLWGIGLAAVGMLLYIILVIFFITELDSGGLDFLA